MGKPESDLNCFLVGGAVRDKLLGLSACDNDYVVVGATPAQMESLGFSVVAKNFPVFLHPESHEEYALARTERKTGQGYNGFTVYADQDVSLEEDLFRRDLTVNAMAIGSDGVLVDPYGGHGDLKAGILRHVNSESFAEDPLRVLRVARFMARFPSFTVATETQALCRAISDKGELSCLPGERIWKEISRGLMEPAPRRMFEFLRECGALAVLAPELNTLHGVAQNAVHHPEIDTFVHTLMVLDQAVSRNASLLTRYLCLVHDLGKGATDPNKWPSHVGHEELGVPLVAQLSARWRVPAEFKHLGMLMSRYHLNVHRILEARTTTVVKLLKSLDAFRRPAHFQQLVEACLCDARGRLGYEDRPYPQKDYLEQCFAAVKAVNTKEVVAGVRKPENVPQTLHGAFTRAVATVVKDVPTGRITV